MDESAFFETASHRFGIDFGSGRNRGLGTRTLHGYRCGKITKQHSLLHRESFGKPHTERATECIAGSSGVDSLDLEGGDMGTFTADTYECSGRSEGHNHCIHAILSHQSYGVFRVSTFGHAGDRFHLGTVGDYDIDIAQKFLGQYPCRSGIKHYCNAVALGHFGSISDSFNRCLQLEQHYLCLGYHLRRSVDILTGQSLIGAGGHGDAVFSFSIDIY